MTHHEYTEELDSHQRAERGLVALQIFAELTQQGGANAVADTQGITLVVPQLIGALLHLLDLETIPVGPAIDDALNWYTAECEEEGKNLPDPIEMLRMIYELAKEEGPGITHDHRLDAIRLSFEDRGWTDGGSPFEL